VRESSPREARWLALGHEGTFPRWAPSQKVLLPRKGSLQPRSRFTVAPTPTQAVIPPYLFYQELHLPGV